MSGIDYPALLAELERQRAASAQEIADLDELIPAVRKRAGTVVPVGLQLPLARNGAKNGKTVARVNTVGRGGLPADKLATMRTQYEAGVSGRIIAERVGTTSKTIYKRAKQGGWKRGDKTTAAEAKVVAATLASHHLSGSVKCDKPECGKWTDFDPCRSCGKPLKRKF